MTTPRFRLLALIAQAHRRIAHLDGTIPTTGGDDADQATAHEHRESFFGTRAQLRAQILEAEEALARHDDGVYGRCVDCGERIAAKRLDALPTALRCVGCQSAAERGLVMVCSS